MLWLDRMLDAQPGERIVDLGSGAGSVARHLGLRGAEVHSVDLSENAVACCRRRCADLPNVHFAVADAGDCRHLESAAFDKVACLDLIEHVDDSVMVRVFREAHRLLKVDGLLYVYSPNRSHWIERLKRRNLILRQPAGHTHVRTVRQVRAALEQCGFSIVRDARPTSMIPLVRWLERLWICQPLWPELGVYRVCILARKDRR